MLIKLEQIHKVYSRGKPNEFIALRGVDLEIAAGEFVAILGPSGSGKTTLMNILGALDTPSAGSYKIKDKDISKYQPDELARIRNQEIGFVFQQFNLLPRATVAENVLLPSLYGKVKNPEAQMRDVLAKVGLENKLQNRPNQLSGGQMQRVAVARALMMNPSIIMADEPTGNLDSKTAYDIMNLFKELNQAGNTIILVTHEADIAEYARRRIRLKDGLIESDQIYA